MTYNTLDNITGLDLKGFLQFPSLATPLFWPLILFVVYIVFTFTLFFGQREREVRASILSSLAVAGYFTTVVAVIFSLLELVQYEIVVLTLVIALVFQVFYMFSQKG